MKDFFAWYRTQWDRVTAFVLLLCGAIALIAGWIGVSGSTLTTEQIPYLASGAVGGIWLLGVAATLWVSADLRDEWRKLDDIYRRLDGTEPGGDVDPDTSVNGSSADTRHERARAVSTGAR